MHVCVTRVVRVTEPATIGRLRCNARSIELHADMLTCCCCVAGVGARAPAGPPARLWADASPCSRTPGGPLRPHSTACCEHRACSGPQAICRRKVLVTSISECLKTVQARAVPARNAGPENNLCNPETLYRVDALYTLSGLCCSCVRSAVVCVEQHSWYALFELRHRSVCPLTRAAVYTEDARAPQN